MIKEFTLKYMNDLQDTLRESNLENVEEIVHSLLAAYEGQRNRYLSWGMEEAVYSLSFCLRYQ